MLSGAAPVVAADVQQDKPVAGGDEQPVVLPVITVTANPSNEIGYVATQSTTGTKTDTPLIETPQSILVITKDQLDTQEADTLIFHPEGLWAEGTAVGALSPRCSPTASAMPSPLGCARDSRGRVLLLRVEEKIGHAH